MLNTFENHISMGGLTCDVLLGNIRPLIGLKYKIDKTMVAVVMVRRRRLKPGFCASLLAPSSTAGWVSCNEEILVFSHLLLFIQGQNVNVLVIFPPIRFNLKLKSGK